jgi:hypothetical protein
VNEGSIEPVSGAPTGRPLQEVLDRVDRRPPTAAVIEQTMLQLEERRARGARFLSDITADERKRCNVTRRINRIQTASPGGPVTPDFTR